MIGDLAAFEQDGQLVPGVAPAAIQEARHAAGNITRALKGKLYVPFRYRDKGMLAVIGRAAAVANLRHLKLSGFIAWLLGDRPPLPPDRFPHPDHRDVRVGVGLLHVRAGSQADHGPDRPA